MRNKIEVLRMCDWMCDFISDNVVMTRADVGSVKREWACNARAVIAGLNGIPDALSSAVKGNQSLLCREKIHPYLIVTAN